MPILARRTMLASAALMAAAMFDARSVRVQAAGDAAPFTLPPLPYAPDANEPHIDAQTMLLHHDKHHAAYVANLNKALADYPQVAALGLTGMLSRLGEVPEAVRTAVRNQGGGHANHSMFWTIMGGKGGVPSGDLAAAIDRDFGGLPALQTAFNKMGAGIFGSGWVFVTVTREGKLALAARPNQDTPISDGARVLLGNDVWEHAYYLKYQNRRADYLAAWWNVLHWGRIATRYDAAKAGTLEV
jgi:Fe-Mn family superoxide dismutase